VTCLDEGSAEERGSVRAGSRQGGEEVLVNDGRLMYMQSTGRETLIREMPIRRVQATGEEDGRAEGGEG
jgi:hypothetical protein